MNQHPAPAMEIKTIPYMYAKFLGDRTVVGLASITGNIDDGLDRIWKGAFTKTIAEQGRRIKHLWQHEYWTPPTAVIKGLREIDRKDLPEEVRTKLPEATGGLEVEREYLPTARGDEILAGIRTEAITEMSIGYETIKSDPETIDVKDLKGVTVRNLRENKLYDTSDVNWGMNSATVAAKAAVPFADHGTADEGTKWSAPSLGDFTDSSWDELTDAEKRRIAAHYAWSKSMPPESFGDLKLPHHQAGKSGVGKAVWGGVAAAMGALLGARGGVEIPAGDKAGVYGHLEKHYKQFDKEPPPLKMLEIAAAAKALLVPGELKVGWITTEQNLDRLRNALGTIQEILLAAEPPTDEKSAKALTESLRFAIEIREREIMNSVR